MGKSPIPKPHDWDKWSWEQQLAFIEKHFIKPISRYNRMEMILLCVTLVAIIIYFIYLTKI